MMSQVRQRREKNCDGVGLPTYSDGHSAICYFALRTQKWCRDFLSVTLLKTDILANVFCDGHKPISLKLPFIEFDEYSTVIGDNYSPNFVLIYT